MIITREPRLRLSGHGRRLRLHASGGDDADPLALVRECHRASLAIEKALGEAISAARVAGRGWDDIAEAIGAPRDATTRRTVIEARVEQQRFVWQRFWLDGDP